MVAVHWTLRFYKLACILFAGGTFFIDFFVKKQPHPGESVASQPVLMESEMQKEESGDDRSSSKEWEGEVEDQEIEQDEKVEDEAALVGILLAMLAA